MSRYLVATPDCKVDVPAAELELDASDSVSEIPPHQTPALLGVGRDCGNVQQLASPPVHSTEHDEGTL